MESLLDGLDEPDRRELMRSARRRRFKRGEVVFHEADPGDTMHVVMAGHFAVRAGTPMGDVAMLRVVRPGEFFGELALVAPAPRNATVAAVDAAETLGIQRTLLDDLRSQFSWVDAFIQRALALEVRRLAAALTDAMYLPSDVRVLRRLAGLAETFGSGSGPATVVPMTQDDLAQLAGVTRPTANRVVKKAEADGLVRVARGRIEIPDVEALARRAR